MQTLFSLKDDAFQLWSTFTSWHICCTAFKLGWSFCWKKIFASQYWEFQRKQTLLGGFGPDYLTQLDSHKRSNEMKLCISLNSFQRSLPSATVMTEPGIGAQMFERSSNHKANISREVNHCKCVHSLPYCNDHILCNISQGWNTPLLVFMQIWGAS